MILQNDFDLSTLTTLRLGGSAKRLLTPESTQELLTLFREEKPQYCIGGGSNLLIAERPFELVVDLRSFNRELVPLGEGRFRVGASLRLQKLIQCVNAEGYGGIEYLYSVPGLVGGAVVMNAGRGRQWGQSIADHIVSVDCIRDGSLVTIPKDACGFAYRDSCFKRNGWLVTGCVMQFPAMPEETSTALRNERLEHCRRTQDTTLPNCGSVFSSCNAPIMRCCKRLRLGKRIHFSGKKTNWIVNDGGSAEEAIRLIRRIQRLHRFLHQRCETEVVIWD